MNVVTLDADSLRKAARSLSILIKERGIYPAAIVGIRSGGERVALLMHEDFPEALLVAIDIHRPSSPLKSHACTLLRHLPRPVADLLRKLEWRLTMKNPVQEKRVGNIALPTEKFAELETGTLLVVDDAADTGSTLLKATDALHASLPGWNVVTAVVTQTTDSPVAIPDFTLYKNTLIRFPWSADFR